MELLIVILLLTVVLLGGTMLFYRNLRSSGLADVDLNLNVAMRSTLSAIERGIRYSQVNSLDTGVRDDCLNSGTTGLIGTTLTTTDMQGLVTTYSLDVLNGMIASSAAETGKVAYLSPPSISITGLTFTWYCQNGVSDKIKIGMDATSSALGSNLNLIRNVSREVNLLNSGIN